jgi:hypothetical protein
VGTMQNRADHVAKVIERFELDFQGEVAGSAIIGDSILDVGLSGRITRTGRPQGTGGSGILPSPIICRSPPEGLSYGRSRNRSYRSHD